MITACILPWIEMERNLIQAAAGMISESDCHLLHVEVERAVGDVLSELSRGYYGYDLAVKKLQSKVFFIKLNLGNN